MRRYVPGLHSKQEELVNNLDGYFLVQIESASYHWHPQKPFLSLRFGILEPVIQGVQSFSARIYCTERALWKLNWFLHDFGYDPELLGRDQIDTKALMGLRGVIRTTCVRLNGHSYQNLEAFAPAAEWQALPHEQTIHTEEQGCGDDL